MAQKIKACSTHGAGVVVLLNALRHESFFESYSFDSGLVNSPSLLSLGRNASLSFDSFGICTVMSQKESCAACKILVSAAEPGKILYGRYDAPNICSSNYTTYCVCTVPTGQDWEDSSCATMKGSAIDLSSRSFPRFAT